MHPAYSVIYFTTASGAGYGLLIWLALLAALESIPTSLGLGLAGFVISLGLISTGLLSSTLHLGRPERAWRALSQWRSSWLSREGVIALATYVPAGGLALMWLFAQQLDSNGKVLAVVTAAMAFLTVFSTGMIYASLPTIRQWYQKLVTPVYLALALASGGVWANFLLTVSEQRPNWVAPVTVGLLALAAFLKFWYWRTIDTEPKSYTSGSATGLGNFGKVRSLEPAHTRPNFVMREMGYKVARANAQKLRQVVYLLAFLIPAILLLVLPVSPLIDPMLSFLAVGAVMAGVFVERWLFFAEAEHVVTLFYGAERA